MADRDRTRTPNGKFDSRCTTCGMAVYSLWVDDVPPPLGCTDGYDQEPWRCSRVYNNFTAIMLKLDGLLDGPISPEGQAMMKRLGPKADELIAHIRAGKSPEEWHKKHGTKRQMVPEYHKPTVN